MKKFFSISLSLLILLQSLNVTFEDFGNFNVLLEHASFHQEEYGDSFIEFLTTHYFEIEEDANKHQEHQNLPFKHNINNFANTNLACLNETLVFEITEINLPKSTTNYFYTESYSYSNKASIFQPPKNA